MACLKAYIAGDHAADALMLRAAYDSGRAIATSKTTAAHAMSYGLTKKLGIAHGHACMLTLPLLWENAQEFPELALTLKETAAVMRLPEARVPRLLRALVLCSGLGIPAMPDEAALQLLADGVNPERLGNHPVRLSRSDLLGIYRRALTPLAPQEEAAARQLWSEYEFC